MMQTDEPTAKTVDGSVVVEESDCRAAGYVGPNALG
jgi:hypothetical protein